MSGLIYVAKMWVSSDSGKLVYKVGCITTPERGYPKHWIFCHFVDNAKDMETTLLAKLRLSFYNARSYGLEYFEGDPEHLIRTVSTVVEPVD